MNKEAKYLLDHIASVMALRKKVAGLLSDALGIPVAGLFYAWIRSEVEQVGEFGKGWRYFFHGLDCTLGNDQSGEKARLEFGPQGRVDTFTESVLLQMQDSDLYYGKANAKDLFQELCESNYVGYVDYSLHERVSTLGERELDEYMKTLSDEKQMDAMVCDRLALTKQ